MNKTLLVSIAIALPSIGCDDIHIGDPWSTASIQVTAGETSQSDLHPDGSVAPPTSQPVITFHWDGFIAEEVRVEECLYDCENQPAEFCWGKTDDYIENAILPRQARNEDTGCGWSAGACASFQDCPGQIGDGDDGVDYTQMISPSIDYGELPPQWFVEEQATPLVDGSVYAVGVFGFDCSHGTEPCEQVFGCRFFRMENGQPIMMQGTGD